MDLRDLVLSLISMDALAARQWVADAESASLQWSDISAPEGFDQTAMAIAAGIVEMLAQRAGQLPPKWTASVPPAPRHFFLVRAANEMPRLRRLCEENGPEPLRRRKIFAPPDFLTAA